MGVKTLASGQPVPPVSQSGQLNADLNTLW